MEKQKNLYLSAKETNSLVKKGFETAETTLWLVSSPIIKQAEQRSLLTYVDDFSCRQLDKIENGISATRNLLSIDVIGSVKEKKTFTLAQSGKQYADNGLEIGKEKVEAGKKFFFTEQIIFPDNFRELSSKSFDWNQFFPTRETLVQTTNSVLTKTESLLDYYLPPDENELVQSCEFEDNDQPPPILARLQRDLYTFSKRVQKRTMPEVKTSERIKEVKKKLVQILSTRHKNVLMVFL